MTSQTATGSAAELIYKGITENDGMSLWRGVLQLNTDKRVAANNEAIDTSESGNGVVTPAVARSISEQDASIAEAQELEKQRSRGIIGTYNNSIGRSTSQTTSGL